MDNYPECPNCGKPIITHALTDTEKELWKQFNLCGTCIGQHYKHKCCGTCVTDDCDGCTERLSRWNNGVVEEDDGI
jgi:hypothetical protein